MKRADILLLLLLCEKTFLADEHCLECPGDGVMCTYCKISSLAAIFPFNIRCTILVCSSSVRSSREMRGIIGTGAKPSCFSQGWFIICSRLARLSGSLSNSRLIKLQETIHSYVEIGHIYVWECVYSNTYIVHIVSQWEQKPSQGSNVVFSNKIAHCTLDKLQCDPS